MAGAKAFVDRLSAFMPLEPEPPPEPMTAVERGLLDLWRRSAPSMPRLAQQTFRRAVEEMLESWLWELANHMLNRIPDPVDYVEMRRATFGSRLTISLCRLALGGEISPALWQTRTMSGLSNSAQDFCCLMNDLFSYQKEIQFEGELHNGVLVVQKFLDCGPQEAAATVNKLMKARIEQFEHIAATELSAMFDDFELDAAARAKVERYVADLERWMAGVLHWHRETRRYREDVLLETPTVGRVLYGPTGLGAAGGRIAPSGRMAPADARGAPRSGDAPAWVTAPTAANLPFGAPVSVLEQIRSCGARP